MKMKTCKTCGGDHHAKGYCKIHYRMPSQLNPKPIKRSAIKPKSLIEMCIGYIEDIQIAKIKLNAAVSNLKPKVRSKVKTGKITLPELISRTEKVFNAWIRKRDSEYTGAFKCISCGLWKKRSECQAGHYRPSTYSALRFNEWNVHAECESCNCSDDNHLVGYRKNLIAKIGIENVRWLEEHKLGKAFKWDRSELESIIEKYK